MPGAADYGRSHGVRHRRGGIPGNSRTFSSSALHSVLVAAVEFGRVYVVVGSLWIVCGSVNIGRGVVQSGVGEAVRVLMELLDLR